MKTVRLTPGSEPAVLRPPVSKSDAQRALVLAWIRGLPLFEASGDDPADLTVLRQGLAALRENAECEIDCRDGGAPFRFLLTQAALTDNATVHFTGSPRLAKRPHAALLEALKISWNGRWPLTVHGKKPRGSITLEVQGDQSSQYASSLLLGAARIAAETAQPARVVLKGGLASEGYFALTRTWLQQAGFDVDADGWVRAGPPRPLPEVPPDWSSAGYLLLIAWKTKGRVAGLVRGTGHPDESFVDRLAHVGLEVSPASVNGVPTRGLDVDVRGAPDSAPALAALACVLPEKSQFRSTEILRGKESDRVDGIAAFVEAAGARFHPQADGFWIEPRPLHDFTFDARDDHRLAMASATLAVLGNVTLTLTGAQSVVKSFPGFWRELAKTGAGIDQA